MSSFAFTEPKLILVGDSNVGKSSIATRLVDSHFSDKYIPTIGVDFRKYCVPGMTGQLQIWDTAGAENFRALTKSYLCGARAVLIVYDCSSPDAFKTLGRWIQDVTLSCPPVNGRRPVICLAGNKSEVFESSHPDYDAAKAHRNAALARSLMETYKLPVFNVSAKTGQNVANMVQLIHQMIIQNEPAQTAIPPMVQRNTARKEKPLGSTLRYLTQVVMPFGPCLSWAKYYLTGPEDARQMVTLEPPTPLRVSPIRS
eukprot:c38771_g1_i1.p1 GENE.c38771_g1_i1~~c38771_g1_i1.p1  ORF type:complete len:288 (+),score=44.10 c38771_g1_i1:97-864(+)